MTPRQLRLFLVTARAGSLSAAARELGVAQPALSQHVAALEHDLAIKLFERHARGVSLTPAGEKLVRHADAVLRRIDQIRDDLHADETQISGEVRVSLAAALSGLVAPPLFAAVEREHPHLRLKVGESLSVAVRRQVTAGLLDIAVVPNAEDMAGLTVEPVYAEPFYLIGAPALIGGEGPVRFRDIGAMPVVSTDREHDVRRRIESVAVALNAPLNVRYEVNSSGLIEGLIHAGLGVGILPATAFQRAIEDGRLVRRRVVEPEIVRSQSIVMPSDRVPTAAVGAIRQILRRVIAELVADGRLTGRLLPEA